MALSVTTLNDLKSLTNRPLTVEVQSGSALGFWRWEFGATDTPDDISVVQCTFGPPGRYFIFLQEVTSAVIIAALGYTPVNRAGDTMTGALVVGGVQLLIDSNGAIALGGTNVTPYIDFNSYNGAPNDYDARLYAYGGAASTNGAGGLTLEAESLFSYAQIVSATEQIWLETAPYNAYGYSGGTRIIGQSGAAGAAITGASRLSDAGSILNAPIGLLGWGFNDGGSSGSGAWGGYFESRKLAGAQVKPTHGVEIQITDVSGESVVTVNPNSPYNFGATMCLWLGSGGGVVTAQSSSLALGIVSTNTTFQMGMMVGDGAITTVGGVRTAIALSGSESHQINWWDGDVIVNAIYSDGTELHLTGTMVLGAFIATGEGVSTGDAAIELGGERTGSGNAFIDFHAQSGSDFDLRIIRASGANGNATISNAGTGTVSVETDGGSRFTVNFAALYPSTNDGLALGTSSLGWSDLFLASGALINFANGNFTLTHISGGLQTSGYINVANDVYITGVAPGFRCIESDNSNNYFNVVVDSGLFSVRYNNAFPGAIQSDSSQRVGIGVGFPSSRFQVGGDLSQASWTTDGAGLTAIAATFTDTTGSGTIGTRAAHSIGTPTLASSSAVTLTDAATLYISANPTAGSNTTITNGWALWVDSGHARFDGVVTTLSTTVGSLPAASAALTGARAFVTDANSTTFLATAVGGGANAVPVVCNGSAWVIG